MLLLRSWKSGSNEEEEEEEEGPLSSLYITFLGLLSD
jgi:hypothetical protein